MTRIALLVLALAASSGCVSTGYTAGRRPTPPALPGVLHEEARIETKDGAKLLAQSWRPPDGAATKANLVVVHGLKDYSDRYAGLAAKAVARGYAVHAADLRGHGDSEGDRVWVDDFDDYLSDLDLVLARIPEADRSKPTFLFGHSMGGAIVLRHALRSPERSNGLVLSAAALRLPVAAPTRGITRFFGTVFPTLAVLALEDEKFSRDPAVVAAMPNDPMIFDDAGPARTARELFAAVADNADRFEELKTPFLALHGEKDEVTKPEGSKELHERAGSASKTLKLYPELVHDLLHEPERDVVIEDLLGWLDARVEAAR